MLPEVVFFSETENSVSRNTNFFIPDIEGFIILFVYRRIQTVESDVDRPGRSDAGPG